MALAFDAGFRWGMSSENSMHMLCSQVKGPSVQFHK